MQGSDGEEVSDRRPLWIEKNAWLVSMKHTAKTTSKTEQSQKKRGRPRKSERKGGTDTTVVGTVLPNGPIETGEMKEKQASEIEQRRTRRGRPRKSEKQGELDKTFDRNKFPSRPTEANEMVEKPTSNVEQTQKRRGRPRKSERRGESDTPFDRNELPYGPTEANEVIEKQTSNVEPTQKRKERPRELKAQREPEDASVGDTLPNKTIVIKETDHEQNQRERGKYNLRNRDDIMAKWRERIGFNQDHDAEEENSESEPSSDESVGSETVSDDSDQEEEIRKKAVQSKRILTQTSGEVRDGNCRQAASKELEDMDTTENTNIPRKKHIENNASTEKNYTTENEDAANELVSCKKCPEEFCSQEELKLHALVHKNDGGKKRTCEICGLKCTEGRAFLQHVLSHDASAYKCQLCDRVFKVRNGYVDHLRHFHKLFKGKKWERVDPGVPRRNPAALYPEANGDSSHPVLPKDLLGKQMLSTRIPQNFKCKFCDKRFVSEISQLNHEKTIHLNTGTYKCEFCPKRSCLKAD